MATIASNKSQLKGMSFILIIINNPLKVEIALLRYAYSHILIPDIAILDIACECAMAGQYTKWEEKKERI